MDNTYKSDDAYELSVSLVLFKNSPYIVTSLLNSIFEESIDVKIKLYVIDNSPNTFLSDIVHEFGGHYTSNSKNSGYGSAHNQAIFNADKSRYHLIINPDVIIHSGSLKKLLQFMDNNSDIGIVTPRILNPDGSDQFLNKRYPNVLDLFIRRFLPSLLCKTIFKGRIEHYEMRDAGYDSICDVEFISGCFMLCRTDVLKKIGGLDTRFFMYLEDCDLSRKVQNAGYKTVYFPDATITHYWERASHKNFKMTLWHIQSAVRYFNKWGWSFW